VCSPSRQILRRAATELFPVAAGAPCPAWPRRAWKRSVHELAGTSCAGRALATTAAHGVRLARPPHPPPRQPRLFPGGGGGPRPQLACPRDQGEAGARQPPRAHTHRTFTRGARVGAAASRSVAFGRVGTGLAFRLQRRRVLLICLRAEFNARTEDHMASPFLLPGQIFVDGHASGLISFFLLEKFYAVLLHKNNTKINLSADTMRQ